MNKSLATEDYKDLLQDEIRIFLNKPESKIKEELLDGVWDEFLLDLMITESKVYDRIIILEEIAKRFQNLPVKG